MSMIILEPVGGLCNRMRAIASALALANNLGRKLWLVWRRDATLNCSFEELFERPFGVDRIFTLESSMAIRSYDMFTSLFCDGKWDEQEIAGWIGSKTGLSEVESARRAFLRTSSLFYEPCAFSVFRPVRALQESIDRHIASFDHMVGVHIRRTDNEKSCCYSPTELFVMALEEELVEDPAARFFLATDSGEEEALMLEKFGDRMIVHTKQSLRRDDPMAVRDAVVDLYCLSACRKIYGSFWSSFSETAQKIGAAELHVLSRNQ